MKDKGDLELEIIVLNEYVSVRRGRMGRLGEGGMQVEGAWRPVTGQSRPSHGCHLVSSSQELHWTETWAALWWAFWLDPGSWLQPLSWGPTTPADNVREGLALVDSSSWAQSGPNLHRI